MNKEDAIEHLSRQKTELDRVRGFARFSPEFKKWNRDTQIVITKIFGEDTRHIKDFLNIKFSPQIASRKITDQIVENTYRRGIDESYAILNSLIQEIDNYGIEDKKDYFLNNSWIMNIRNICDRFHNVSRQLRSRHANRNTLNIEDEYDVQDLFHALLQIHFDDIRPEEWTPSSAGSSSRVDFLLKSEEAVIEIKKTRNGLGSKELSAQLIVDIHRYKVHPNCKHLICFVYDPEGRIANPRGLETDLNKEDGEMTVEVIIRPY